MKWTRRSPRAVPGGFSEKVWGLDNRQLYRIPEDEVE